MTPAQIENRMHRVLSNCYFNAPIVYVDLRDRLELVQPRTKTIDFKIQNCYYIEFESTYKNQVLIRQGKIRDTMHFEMITEVPFDYNNDQFHMRVKEESKTGNEGKALDRLRNRQPIFKPLLDTFISYRKAFNPEYEHIALEGAYLKMKNQAAIRKLFNDGV